MKWIWKTIVCATLAALGQPAFAAIIGGSNYVVRTYYANPHAAEIVASFDWDASSNLYYATGRPNYDPGFSIYRFAGDSPTLLYTDAGAFAGSRVTKIGTQIYFNDGGTYERYTCDYFRYDPARSRTAPTPLEIQSDIFGLETRNGTDLWAAGGWNAAIHYTALDANGNPVSNPLLNLGVIGSASGPLTFDGEGNLYYAEGYVDSGHPSVYRWTAAEVAAALADPAGAPLNPTDHLWATLSSGSGATSLAVDHRGNLLVTATSFTEMSQLQRLWVEQGQYAGYEILAYCDERLETVRVRNRAIYVSSPDGIFTVTPSQAEKIPFNDYNGDGCSDLAVYDNALGAWYAYALNQSQATVWAETWGWPGAEIVPGDYDGDAVSDLAVYDRPSGAWYAFSVARQVILFWKHTWGGPGFEPVAGDYDGDGISDMAVFNPQAGGWFIATATGTLLAWQTAWGGPGFEPVAGDYDGDGKSDLAVYDASSGEWFIRSLGGAILAWKTAWGFHGGTTVPGDYDGDGAGDLAVYDQGSGAWYVWSPAKNQLIAWQTQWGWSGARPVPGDYDGDGADDLAMFDTTTGDWYIWSVARQSVLAWQQPWGWPGAIPPGSR